MITHIVEDDILVIAYTDAHLHYLTVWDLCNTYSEVLVDHQNSTVALRLNNVKPIQKAVEIQEILDMFRDDIQYQSCTTGEPL